VADKAFHEDCSSCHHDHQGRNESLVRMSDSHCTKCHGNLPGSHVGGKSDIAEHVTGFARDHPEFRPLVLGKAEAERRLKFSHALHMTPGLVYDPNDQHKWTAAELAKQFVPNARERFSSQGSEPIQLQCSSCHQLDAGRVPAQDSERKSFDLIQRTVNGGAWRSLLPPRAEGAYYLPVNFDMHCKVCHPLRTPAAPSGGKVIPEFAVPHRRNPAALRTLLRGEFATRLVNQKHPSLLTPFGPGGRLDPPSSEAAATLGSEVDRLTDATLKTMLQNLGPIDEPGKKESWRAGGGFACGKCHYSTSPEPAKVEIAPLPLRSVWFEHAKFNHVSHRGLTCSSCHPGTEGSFAPGGNVNEREPALIAGIKTCQTCHAPAGQVVERPDGQTATAAGIRHSCVDCHRYHNGDRPLQGLGAAKRDPADPLTLSEWFRGMK